MASHKLSISYQKHNICVASTGLLYANRQLSREIMEAITRCNKISDCGITYRIDLMIQGPEILPTWCSLPAPAKFLQTLEVDLRDPKRQGLRLLGDGGVGPDTWRLLSLLAQSVLRGPRLVCSDCPKPKEFKRLERGRETESICDACSSGLQLNARTLVIHALQLQRKDQRGLGTICQEVANSGLLHGRFKALKFRYGEIIEQWEIRSKSAGQTRTPSIVEVYYGLTSWGAM